MEKLAGRTPAFSKFVPMTYAIDTEGTRAVGATLVTTGTQLRDCGTTFAYAGGLARRGVACDHPTLSAALHGFVTTHLAAIEVIASACTGLGRNLSWAAQSAHQVELSVAADLGLNGAPAPVDSFGVRV